MPRDTRSCAVLVPFSGFIHQECDDALKELERRGYVVRRVAGYAAIDQARNQMASDAVREGFAETLWIDSDIGFDPDTVERLRGHDLPIVCGIYPKKGQRAIACNVLPNTPGITFGDHGGLYELLYAGAGFLHVRRETYLKIQEHCRLPVCNECFGQPLIPFFQPLLQPVEKGPWYLAEDYAFCQRAREAGFKIMADTTIRLWHVGTYRYSWEDSGIEPQRYRTFTLNLDHGGTDKGGASLDRKATAQVDLTPPNPPFLRGGNTEQVDLTPPGPPFLRGGETSTAAQVQQFAAKFPWPAERPGVPPPPERNWLFPSSRELLARLLPSDAKLVVELGSWTGRSTRYIADLAPQARVIAVDHWVGSVEHAHDPELAAFLPRLYETFLSECWDYRERIIPVRATTVDGLRRIHAAGLRPDLVYIDADHRYESVNADLTTTLELFPGATIVGDDWDWESVRKAVEAVASRLGLKVQPHGSAWWMKRLVS